MTRLLLLLALLPSAAMAHSWYPVSCCHDQDCKRVPCDELVETQDGYRYGEVTFSKSAEKPSQDRWCHVCISKAGNGLCVFTLQGT
jgi:hypothetical protein